MKNISQAYFLATKNADGSPGTPFGSEVATDKNEHSGESFAMFDDIEEAQKAQSALVESLGRLSIFRVNVVFVGEVIC